MRKFLCAMAFMSIYGTTNAVTREDVLECGVPDGGKFILRSKYDWSLIPLPMVHSSRETNRGSWGAGYLEQSGKVGIVPASVHYGGKSSLKNVCAHFGSKNGVPLAPFSFRQADQSWYRIENFPFERLDVSHFSLAEGNSVQQQFLAAGIQDEAYNFGWIYPEGKRLVYEKPLYRRPSDYLTPIDAVYQAWSSDGGKTWSEGQVTTDAHIFELGRGWGEQNARARPISLNGERVP